MRKYFILFSLITFFAFFNLSGIESSGHFSLLEGDVKIVKTNGDMLKGNINYPLVTGDVILTGKTGRCEIQLSNGTLLRLDKNSDIKLVSLLTDSVTSNKKISTIKLMSGSVFTMAQIYKNEILQIITPQVSVKMENRSTNLIRTNEKESSIHVLRGKVGVLYGNQSKAYIKSGEFVIFPRKGKKHSSKFNKDDEFISWNKSINKNFKKLHYGKSKVPDVIYIHSPGIVHFAESFSTKFGTWEYNEYFGYVWKPSHEVFRDKRPFFDANYVEINDELVIVPNQAWGWAPVHLGTWFFSKNDGWLWIPGEKKIEELNSRIRYIDGFFWNPEIDYFYMNINTVGLLPGVLFSCNFPVHGNNSLFIYYPLIESLNWKAENWDGVTTEKNTGNTVINIGFKDSNSEMIVRDWNPDSRLGKRAGIKIVYDPVGNIVKFPELNLSTRDMKGWQKLALKKSIFSRNQKGNVSSRQAASGATNMNSNTGISSSGSQSASGVGGGMSGNGSSGGSGSGGGGKEN